MSSETSSLTQALKGKSQTQGAWAEMILQTILEKSGLCAGKEYTFQESRANGDGIHLRPDVVVDVPSGEKVVIDSKVSLSAFHAYVDAQTTEERQRQLPSHLASITKHIETLSDKEYQHLFSTQLNFVIMFVPVEGALAVALQENPDIAGLAAQKNVAIATPTTLMVALKTIANLWHSNAVIGTQRPSANVPANSTTICGFHYGSRGSRREMAVSRFRLPLSQK